MHRSGPPFWIDRPIQHNHTARWQDKSSSKSTRLYIPSPGKVSPSSSATPALQMKSDNPVENERVSTGHGPQLYYSTPGTPYSVGDVSFAIAQAIRVPAHTHTPIIHLDPQSTPMTSPLSQAGRLVERYTISLLERVCIVIMARHQTTTSYPQQTCVQSLAVHTPKARGEGLPELRMIILRFPFPFPDPKQTIGRWWWHALSQSQSDLCPRSHTCAE